MRVLMREPSYASCVALMYVKMSSAISGWHDGAWREHAQSLAAGDVRTMVTDRLAAARVQCDLRHLPGTPKRESASAQRRKTCDALLAAPSGAFSDTA